jgi:hypothetical protein
MKTSLLTVVVGLAGLLGCAQQQLGGGPQPGRDGGVDAGCGPLGKMTCAAPTGCGTTTAVAPICVKGAWTCPPSIGYGQTCEPPICLLPLPSGCTCDPATGMTTCRDAGTDAGATCPSPEIDGGILGCGCGSDTSPPPVCVAGMWACPRTGGPLTVCPRYCASAPPAPPGCMCNPTNGAIICGPDAGADAAPGGHGG